MERNRFGIVKIQTPHGMLAVYPPYLAEVVGPRFVGFLHVTDAFDTALTVVDGNGQFCGHVWSGGRPYESVPVWNAAR